MVNCKDVRLFAYIATAVVFLINRQVKADRKTKLNQPPPDWVTAWVKDPTKKPPKKGPGKGKPPKTGDDQQSDTAGPRRATP